MPQSSVVRQCYPHVPFLPQECLDRIVDSLADSGVAEFKALLACRLSRALYNAATKHLFRKVSFKAKSMAKEDRNALLERIRIFRDITCLNKNSTHKASLVRSLRLYAAHYSDDAKFWVKLSKLLPDILPNLPNVEDFRFRTCATWSVLPVQLKASLIKFCTAPSLRSLRLAKLTPHGDAIENFISPNLQHLALYWTSFTAGTIRPIGNSHYPVLTSFSTYGSNAGPIWRLWQLHRNMFSHLRKLSIGLDNGFISLVATMIHALAGTLECLELTDFRRGYGPANGEIALVLDCIE